MTEDRISQFKVARWSIYLPHRDGNPARYALLVNEVYRGIPRTSIALDGVIPSAPASPHLEDLLLLFDSAVRREMIF